PEVPLTRSVVRSASRPELMKDEPMMRRRPAGVVPSQTPGETSTLGCPRGCAMGDLLSDELVAHDCGGETDPGVLKEVHLGDRHGARGQCLPATKRELSGLISAIDRCTALAVIQSQRGRLHESAAILDSIPPKRDTYPRIGVRRHHEDGIRRNRSSVHD